MSDHDEQTNSNNNTSSSSRSADAPSFLKRHVIDEHTGISFGDAKSSSVPEATRRVGGGISFATLPSASVMPSFTPSLGMGPTMTTLSSKTASVTTAQAAPPPPSDGSWLLRSVPTLPEFHPLERTATFVPNAASDPSQISSRISHVLRDRSIEAHYDNDKAKVRCTSMDGVDFRIRLYRGRGPSYSHGIIVEVQRRFGTSYTFHHDTQAILDAAHGKNVASATPMTATSTSGSAALPMVSDAEVTDSEADFTNSPPPPSTSSMDMVATMFSYPGYDSQYLAYQTLIPLTSSARMGRSTAKTVATQLLQPGNAVGAKVLDAVLAVPASQARLPSSGPSRRGSLEDDSDDEDEDTSSGSDEEFTTKLQTMAWTVLSNAVHATKGQAVNSTVREELRPALLRALQEASANPRHAQMAALCAEHLIELGHDNDDLVDALERAVEVGRVKHAGLKAQAQRCLDKIRRM